MVFLPFSNVIKKLYISSNLVDNGQLLETIYQKNENSIYLIKICEDWRDYKNLLQIEKKKKDVVWLDHGE